MTSGQVYGAGIYLAADSNTSMTYARPMQGWKKSILNQSGVDDHIQILALCEVINGYKANPYYVVPNEDHVTTRYLFVFNSKNAHRYQVAHNLKIPEADYGRFQKDLLYNRL
jgi:poly [ADP-ribose] polymerase 6/8